ncbi:lantibiotic dehydratase [Clostridium estertheticum]|uniref:lantibiotic dehydratase n=1 Tax=Clostridium estertheticum TaxID=238834 RepID=UPI001C6F063C|nr:lantibiotic dehydratase [Clostridium estertheticum]MBW9173852.1 lantibiotic dehydratase [Clostridium estertheticum]WLC77779.1 lantibiotic dehydratase [Clostridium estertheticum]
MKNNLYKNVNTFMIRTPLKPIDKYFEFFNNTVDGEKAKEYVKELCNDPVFRESILVSSKSLYDTIINFTNGKDIKKQEYFFRSIYKYLIRMSTRPTPFGLVSGVCFGNYSDKTSITYEDNQFKKFARPDLEWIMEILKKIEDKYYQSLMFKINGYIFIKGDRAVLPHSTLKEDTDNVTEVSIRATNAFKLVCEVAQNTISYSQLKNSLLIKNPGVPEEKINFFLKELINKEYLISNLRPPLTVIDQFDYLIKEIQRCDINEIILDQLINIQEKINIYNKTYVGEGESIYIELCKDMNNMEKCKTPLQVDMKLNMKEKTINSKIIDDLNELIHLLLLVSPSSHNSQDYFQIHKMDFMEKYGQEREILLLEMIDNDLGIGAPATYVHPKNNRSKTFNSSDLVNKKVKSYLLQKYIYALDNNYNSIEINDDEIKALDLPQYNYEEIPNSLELNVIVRADSEEEFKKQNLNYHIGPNVGSPQAGKAFGRFSHLMNSPEKFFSELNDNNKALIDNDEYIHCELVYLGSELRSANVTRNIHCNEYEIALFTNTSKSDEYSLTLDDILIGIEDNVFYAKSKKLNKKLFITVNNMLNSSMAPNAVRFLYDISLDGGKKWFDLPWNDAFYEFPYVPNIKYKNITISQEKWILDSINVKGDKKLGFDKFKDSFKLYCSSYKVPQYVYITFADNRILLNLEDNKCLEILYHEFTNNLGDTITLNAYEEEPYNIVNGNDGNYFCELIVPLIKVKGHHPKDIQISNKSSDIPSISPTRLKLPFDDWLYFKLYGTSSSDDELIAFFISEYFHDLVDSQKIEKYFFMRYADPEQHIRLRINAKQSNLLEIYPNLQQWFRSLIEKGIITHIAIDSYDREIERYGGSNLMDVAENVFYADSIITEDILKEKKFNNLTLSYELIGMISIIQYMDQFGLDYENQCDFLESLVEKTDYREIFKKQRSEFMKLCNSNDNWNGLRQHQEGELLLNILNNRTKSIQFYSSEIRKRNNNSLMSEWSILNSVIHLHCNRLFGINREFEKKILTLTRHTLHALRYFKKGSEVK